MVSYILIILAAILNSAMDVISFHYSTSIFSKYNPQLFDPSISWTNKYIDHDPKKGMRKWFFGLFDIPVALTDAWHLFKSSMVILVISCAAFYQPFVGELLCRDLAITNNLMYILVRVVDIIIMGTLWNCTFSLCFNHLLVASKKS